MVSNKISETFHFLWGVIRNPDVVWEDADGKTASVEQWTRAQRWHVFRPMWTHYVFTTNPGCGCRKRFGLWSTMWCSDHANLWGDES